MMSSDYLFGKISVSNRCDRNEAFPERFASQKFGAFNLKQALEIFWAEPFNNSMIDSMLFASFKPKFSSKNLLFDHMWPGPITSVLTAWCIVVFIWMNVHKLQKMCDLQRLSNRFVFESRKSEQLQKRKNVPSLSDELHLFLARLFRMLPQLLGQV